MIEPIATTTTTTTTTHKQHKEQRHSCVYSCGADVKLIGTPITLANRTHARECPVSPALETLLSLLPRLPLIAVRRAVLYCLHVTAALVIAADTQSLNRRGAEVPFVVPAAPAATNSSTTTEESARKAQLRAYKLVGTTSSPRVPWLRRWRRRVVCVHARACVRACVCVCVCVSCVCVKERESEEKSAQRYPQTSSAG